MNPVSYHPKIKRTIKEREGDRLEKTASGRGGPATRHYKATKKRKGREGGDPKHSEKEKYLNYTNQRTHTLCLFSIPATG